MSYQDLKDLDELRKSGAITEEEYQKEKRKILDGNGNQFGNKAFFGMKENSYIALMHVTILAGYFMVFIGFFIPVVLWLLNRENSARVDAYGKDIINFMLTWLIYSVGAGILCIILVGIPILIIVAITEFIFVVIAAIKTNNGENWRYPMTITFLK